VQKPFRPKSRRNFSNKLLGMEVLFNTKVAAASPAMLVSCPVH